MDLLVESFLNLAIFYYFWNINRNYQSSLKSLRNPFERCNRWIANTSLNLGNIGLIDPGKFGEPLLRNTRACSSR